MNVTFKLNTKPFSKKKNYLYNEVMGANIQLRWLGNAGLQFEHKDILVVDPFLSRPVMGEFLFSTLETNFALQEAILPECDYILITQRSLRPRAGRACYRPQNGSAGVRGCKHLSTNGGTGGETLAAA